MRGNHLPGIPQQAFISGDRGSWCTPPRFLKSLATLTGAGKGLLPQEKVVLSAILVSAKAEALRESAEKTCRRPEDPKSRGEVVCGERAVLFAYRVDGGLADAEGGDDEERADSDDG
eukprot:g6357.t1